MPQGFNHPPHLFNQVLKKDLTGLHMSSKYPSAILYVDDLLVCSPTMEQCQADSIAVHTKLAQGGHKVSLKNPTILSAPGRIFRLHHCSRDQQTGVAAMPQWY